MWTLASHSVQSYHSSTSQQLKQCSKNFCMKIITLILFNALPNDRILNMTKLKSLADDKLKVSKMRISLFDRVENAVGKGENTGYQHFLLFPVFSKAVFFRVVNSRDCVVKI